MNAGTYSQTFDALAKSGTSLAWTNNEILPGWYASRTVAPTDVAGYDAGTGGSTTGALYSFGSSGSSDRALGSLASGGQGNIAFGVCLLNDTGFNRTNLIVSYTGEQWRVANASIHSLVFSYRIAISLTNADARATQSWTPFPSLDFNGPNTNATQTLNGNAATNRVTLANIILADGRRADRSA